MLVIEQKVRVATPEDAKAIDHLIGMACEYERLAYSPLPDTPRKIYVAEVDNQVVGMCVVFFQDREVQLSHLYVLEQHRGHGLGRTLVTTVIGSVPPGTGIMLFTDQTKEAMQFFQHIGFRRGRLVNMRMVMP